MKKYWMEILCVIQSLLVKLISFKNLVFLFATVIGFGAAKSLHGTFKEWALYEGGLLVLFYTTNQFQKWLFSRVLPGCEEEEKPAE